MNSETPPRARGPGLAKTRGNGRLFLRRAVELWTSVPGAMASLVRAADVVSEGEVQDERGRRTYYGSTSLLFVPGPQTQSLSSAELCARLAGDPHVRVLALRVAVREATHRAGAEAGSGMDRNGFREAPRGVLVTIDITVPLDAAAARMA